MTLSAAVDVFVKGKDVSCIPAIACTCDALEATTTTVNINAEIFCDLGVVHSYPFDGSSLL